MSRASQLPGQRVTPLKSFPEDSQLRKSLETILVNVQALSFYISSLLCVLDGRVVNSEELLDTEADLLYTMYYKYKHQQTISFPLDETELLEQVVKKTSFQVSGNAALCRQGLLFPSEFTSAPCKTREEIQKLLDAKFGARHNLLEAQEEADIITLLPLPSSLIGKNPFHENFSSPLLLVIAKLHENPHPFQPKIATLKHLCWSQQPLTSSNKKPPTSRFFHSQQTAQKTPKPKRLSSVIIKLHENSSTFPTQNCNNRNRQYVGHNNLSEAQKIKKRTFAKGERREPGGAWEARGGRPLENGGDRTTWMNVGSARVHARLVRSPLLCRNPGAGKQPARQRTSQ